MLPVMQCVTWLCLQLQTEYDMFIPLQRLICLAAVQLCCARARELLTSSHIRSGGRPGKRGAAMQDRSRVLPPWWKAPALAAAACALLLLSSAGLLYLLARQRELTEELLRLDAQMQEVLRRCRLQEGTAPPPHPAEELKILHRSRRDENGTATRGQDEKDVMLMVTYSMVPVRNQNTFLNSLSQVVCNQIIIRPSAIKSLILKCLVGRLRSRRPSAACSSFSSKRNCCTSMEMFMSSVNDTF